MVKGPKNCRLGGLLRFAFSSALNIAIDFSCWPAQEEECEQVGKGNPFQNPDDFFLKKYMLNFTVQETTFVSLLGNAFSTFVSN